MIMISNNMHYNVLFYTTILRFFINWEFGSAFDLYRSAIDTVGNNGKVHPCLYSVINLSTFNF